MTVEAKSDTYPTKLGKIVHDRACVRIGTLLFKASRRLENGTKYGPIPQRFVSRTSSSGFFSLEHTFPR